MFAVLIYFYVIKSTFYSKPDNKKYSLFMQPSNYIFVFILTFLILFHLKISNINDYVIAH